MQIMTRDPYAFGDDGEVDDEGSGPSKSEIKREMHGLQELGRELTKLPEETLARVSPVLPENVLEAVREFRRIKTFKAQQRHIQHIGKLLRAADASAIRTAMEDAGGASAAMVAIQHQCERLRDELLASDEALTRLVDEHPSTDIQRLRQTIRMARREAAKEDPAKRSPRPFREIYQILREALTAEREAGLAAQVRAGAEQENE
ncbi:ribosome biogenesis factor YjgA [Mesosutterella sp. AGMB02718]|uniref:Dual-action ribosomal maturation protein DarP n=1 Tax=Mesosutterella faecium TaxID=2925194 RepID=A0ABT7IJK1_9BURK|nr:ribosome biogenesis factor YjgA [Mesosutterella sp. AGMB02718]MDL2058550.1 ribosome biogenesis factor YjgA [Mesosutterella sp. AGMB02718]